MATAITDTPVVLVFEYDKETKGTRRFSHMEGGPVNGSLYVKKDYLEVLGNPTVLTATVVVK